MNYEEQNHQEPETLEENTNAVSEEAKNDPAEEETPVSNVDDTLKETEQAIEQEEEKPQKKGWKRELLEWIESLGVAIVVVLLLTNFVFRFVVVDGNSMEPTLHHKNQLFVFRLGYEPDNGDIIVFKPRGDQDKYYIKRVIATEGQTVDIKAGDVYVDGVKLEEEYISARIASEYPGQYPKTVPQDCVFVLGDNRNASRDSRDEIGVGMVEEDSIVGKALFRIMPLSQFGGVYENYNLK
ncbi:MAG: signal peptidase I [Clostridia bacterium]|nr:signal peptidase I [Clostridia bacterium]